MTKFWRQFMIDYQRRCGFKLLLCQFGREARRFAVIEWRPNLGKHSLSELCIYDDIQKTVDNLTFKMLSLNFLQQCYVQKLRTRKRKLSDRPTEAIFKEFSKFFFFLYFSLVVYARDLKSGKFRR